MNFNKKLKEYYNKECNIDIINVYKNKIIILFIY